VEAVMDLKKLYNSLNEGVDTTVVASDDDFYEMKKSSESGVATPIAVRLKFRIAQKEEQIQTLEGPETVPAGGYIMTGTIGEKYAISPEKFPKKYTDIKMKNGVEGEATKIVDGKKYEYLDPQKPFKAKTWAGVISGDANSVLLRYGDGDYGIIRKDLFNTLYKRK
jgi:hypothetical protein